MLEPTRNCCFAVIHLLQISSACGGVSSLPAMQAFFPRPVTRKTQRQYCYKNPHNCFNSSAFFLGFPVPNSYTWKYPELIHLCKCWGHPNSSCTKTRLPCPCTCASGASEPGSDGSDSQHTVPAPWRCREEDPSLHRSFPEVARQVCSSHMAIYCNARQVTS